MPLGYITCSVEDYKGKSAVSKIRVTDPTVAKALILAEFIKTHSDARVTGYGVSMDYAGDECDSGKYDRVLQAMRYFYEKTDGTSLTFSIPAPRDEDVDEDQEPISDMGEDVRDMLVSVGACTSAAIYQGGGLKSRVPGKTIRKRAATGV